MSQFLSLELALDLRLRRGRVRGLCCLRMLSSRERCKSHINIAMAKYYMVPSYMYQCELVEYKSYNTSSTCLHHLFPELMVVWVFLLL